MSKVRSSTSTAGIYLKRNQYKEVDKYGNTVIYTVDRDDCIIKTIVKNVKRGV